MSQHRPEGHGVVEKPDFRSQTWLSCVSPGRTPGPPWDRESHPAAPSTSLLLQHLSTRPPAPAEVGARQASPPENLSNLPPHQSSPFTSPGPATSPSRHRSETGGHLRGLWLNSLGLWASSSPTTSKWRSRGVGVQPLRCPGPCSLTRTRTPLSPAVSRRISQPSAGTGSHCNSPGVRGCFPAAEMPVRLRLSQSP